MNDNIQALSGSPLDHQFGMQIARATCRSPFSITVAMPGSSRCASSWTIGMRAIRDGHKS